jgi:uncharacterized protein YjbI with pentapeptide repeats
MMKVALPQITAELEAIADPSVRILADEPFIESLLTDANLYEVNAKGIRFSEVKAERVKFGGAKFEKSDFMDVLATACDFTATDCSESSWRRVHIKNSRCSGILLQNGGLEDITFEGCKLDLANFRYTKLKNVRFIDCVLENVDFYEATLKNITFEGCELTNAEFSQAKLMSVDLRSSTFESIKGINSMKGAIIDSAQLVYLAPIIATQLGFIVKD